MNQFVVVVTGPLERFRAGFEARLVELGYRPRSVLGRLVVVAQFSRWLAAGGVEAQEIAPRWVDGFVDQVASTSQHRRRTARRSLSDLVAYLGECGVVTLAPATVVSGPDERLLQAFAEYLVRERGVASHTGTVRDYQRIARLFLSEAVPAASTGSVGGLADVTTGDVTRFVVSRCRARSSRSAQLLVTALRAWLRYLYLEALTDIDLGAAVPKVASWRGGSLPRALGPGQVRQLFTSCDRRTLGSRGDRNTY
jgi:integrase/recombinase XerD